MSFGAAFFILVGLIAFILITSGINISRSEMPDHEGLDELRKDLHYKKGRK